MVQVACRYGAVPGSVRAAGSVSRQSSPKTPAASGAPPGSSGRTAQSPRRGNSKPFVQRNSGSWTFEQCAEFFGGLELHGVISECSSGLLCDYTTHGKRAVSPLPSR